MSQILDEDFREEKQADPTKDQLAFLSSVIMLIGGVFFIKHTTISGGRASFIQLLIVSFAVQVLLLLLSVFFNFTLRILKGGIKNKSEILHKTFFLQCVQIGFVLWLVLVGLVLLDKVFL